MMNNRASIAIFKNAIEYDEDTDKPFVPSIIFETAKKVAETKGCELVKTKNGLYVVKYSPTGPFVDTRLSGDDWLPVYIARIEKWSSGGIRKNEMPNLGKSNS